MEKKKKNEVAGAGAGGGEFFRRAALKLFAEFRCDCEKEHPGEIIEYLTMLMRFASDGHLREPKDMVAVDFFIIGREHTQRRLDKERLALKIKKGVKQKRADHVFLYGVCESNGICRQVMAVFGNVTKVKVSFTSSALKSISKEFDAFAIEMAADRFMEMFPQILVTRVGQA